MKHACFGEDRFACEDKLSGAWHLEQRFKVGVDIGDLNQHNCKPREITSSADFRFCLLGPLSHRWQETLGTGH